MQGMLLSLVSSVNAKIKIGATELHLFITLFG